MRHHALRKERVERLLRTLRQVTCHIHRAGKETGIEQVQDRVLNTADVLIDIHPIGCIIDIRRRCGVWRREARVIPRGIHEGIHRVSLARCRGAAFWAGAVAPCWVAVQRIPRNVERHIIGQLYRQVFFGLGHNTTGVAVHNRDWAAPVALAAEAPITQAELRVAFAQVVRLEIIDCRINRLLARCFFDAREMINENNRL